MSISERRRLPVRGPADLLTVVPYLIGFHPDTSLVILAAAGKRIVFASRHDLPTPGDDLTDYRQTLAVVAATATQHATETILVGYGPATLVTPVIDLARTCMAEAGLPVLEALRLTGDRYFSYLCHNPACCPLDGVPYQPGQVSAVRAEAAVAGMVALPSRADLVASIAPLTGEHAQHIGRAVIRAAQRLTSDVTEAAESGDDATADDRATRLIQQHGTAALTEATRRHRAGNRLDDDEAANLLLLLRHIPVRDHAFRHTDPADLGLWTDLTRRAPTDLVPAAATLLAFTALRAGHGALANIALDRAVTADPDYTMAHLLRHAISIAIPPTTLASWVAELAATNPE